MSTESTGPPLSAGLHSPDTLAPQTARAGEVAAELRQMVEGGAPQGLAAERLLELTEALFPGPVRFERICDPEEPRREFAVLTVAFGGDPQEAVRRRRMWHAQAAEVLGSWGCALRLSVVPAAAVQLPAAHG